MQLKIIQGYIFDLDETLVHSGLDFKKMRQDLQFPDGVGILEYLQEHVPRSEHPRCFEIIRLHEKEGAQRAQAVSGARDYINSLQKTGYPTAVLTRNSLDIAKLSLQACHIPIDLIFSRDCATPKPDPEGLLKICDIWQLSPKDCIYFGDFKIDIETAKNAGMPCALIKTAKNQIYQDHAHLNFSCYSELDCPLKINTL